MARHNGSVCAGIIFNIERFSTHNGPGIRSTVFFKGCPLRCIWCHNPEGLETRREVCCSRTLCRRCGACISACPKGALDFNASGEIVIERGLCDGCGVCVERCPTNARTVFGREISAEELVREVMKDGIFYDESGGGVTFSGGEPLAQIDFLEESLRLCHAKGLHVCLDTSGYAPREYVARVLPYVSLFLYDVKLIDGAAHRRFTGVDNKNILENLRFINEKGKAIWARIPVVPGINDGEENLRATAALLSGLKNLRRVSLLPLHKSAGEKYRGLSKDYGIADYALPAEEAMENHKKLFTYFGLKAYIGG